ncbi:MAG TPA: DUF3488 and transglutaminase-like domain-containing protein [Thermoanaerobaculia bacterium]|nr:DUF3488 and transglutaminase-like domain-containing protein [Thermoanaerobaculia bacterium]
MNPLRRELESIFVTGLAAVPLYFTGAVGWIPIALFHLALGALAGICIIRREPVYRPRLVRWLAYAYLLFFPIDAIFLSRSLIESSSNLLLFIGFYLLVEGPWDQNYTKRLLIGFLLFVASIATATDLSIVVFIVIFAFMMFRQLIQVSHAASVAQVGVKELETPASRPAIFYLVVTGVIAIVMFPFLPRVGTPMIRGAGSSLDKAATGLSDTINFEEARTISPDSQVVARVWMGREAVPFFTPLRLRGTVYDAFRNGEWRSGSGRRLRAARGKLGVHQIARPVGVRSAATIQQVPSPEQRLLLPSGTYVVSGVPEIFAESRSGLYRLSAHSGGSLEYRVALSYQIDSLTPETVPLLEYPVSPEVEAFARDVAGAASTPREIAAKIETHLATQFQYVADPSELGRAVSVEDFLLRERRGHCEYFAAGMVVMLSSLGVPARIVGGYYGGEWNPFTGYFVIRQRDAHAWVEVHDGQRWMTYDPSPADLRPGSSATGALGIYASAARDSIQFFWDRYILTFGSEDQVTLISGVLAAARIARSNAGDTLAAIRSGLTTQLAVILVLGAVLIFLAKTWLDERRRSMFQIMARSLERMGVEIGPADTPEEIVAHVEQTHPELAGHVRHIVDVYVRERFSRETLSAEELLAVRRALSSLASASR